MIFFSACKVPLSCSELFSTVLGRALRPIKRDRFEPPSDGAPEIPRTVIVLGAELMNQARCSEEADPFGFSRGMTAPGEPQIKVEAAGGVCQPSNGMPLGGNRMGLNFSPELFAQLDSIATSMELLPVIFAGIPDAHPIKKKNRAQLKSSCLGT